MEGLAGATQVTRLTGIGSIQYYNSALGETVWIIGAILTLVLSFAIAIGGFVALAFFTLILSRLIHQEPLPVQWPRHSLKPNLKNPHNAIRQKINGWKF